MTLTELKIITATEEEVRFYNDGREMPWQFNLKDCGTKPTMSCGLHSCSWGGGKTKAQAKRDYCEEIEGKVLVVRHRFGDPEDSDMCFQLPPKISPK